MSNTENLSQLVDIKALNTLYKSIQTQLNDRVYTTKGNAQEILGEPNFPYNNAYIVNIAKTEKIHIEKDGALFFKKKAEADEPESNQAKIYYDPNGFRFTEHLIPQVDSLNIGSTTTRINNLYSKNINTNSLESTGAIKLNGTDADDIIKVTNNASPETCVTINYQGIKGITAGKEELFLNKDLTDSVTNVGGYLTTGNKLTVGTSALDNTPKLGLDAHGYSNFYSYINSRGNIYTNGSLIANFGNTTKYIWIASDANENSTVLGNEGFGERFNGAGNGIENKTIFFSRHGGQETDVRTVKGDGSVFFHTSNVTFENNLRVGKGSNNPQISFRDTAADGALLKYDISNDLFQIDTRNSNGSYSVTSFKNGKVTSRAFRGILVGDETSAKWEGALLASEDTTNASETDRSDDSPLGDTWIYADRQGKYWGIYHKQKPNEIIFSNGSGGSQHDEIILDLSNGDIDTVGNITGTNLTANTNITVGTVNDKENTGTITANHFVHRDGTDSNVLTGSGDVVTIDSLNVTGAKGLRADVGSESKPVYFEKKKGDTSSKAYEITSLNLGNHITNTGEISATNFYGRHVSLGENLENTLLVPSESLMSTTWIYTDLKKDSSGKIVPNGRGIYKDKDILSFNSSPSVKQFSFDISDAGGTLTLTKGIKYYNSGNNPDLNLITTLNKTINIGNSNITGVNIKFSDGSTGETNVAMDKNAVFRNYYPTALSWSNGTSAGPTGIISMNSEGTNASISNISFAAIPSASKENSGIVTTIAQEFSGNKTFTSGKIYLTSSSYINYDSSEEAIIFNFV